jgi:predicted Ser/Thr protein kinase
MAKVALGSEPVASGERIPPTPADLAPQFPQLEIIELLGMGGMGMVYKARQARLDRLVALKILPIDATPDASFAERFEREAKALAKLNHPGIVTLYDFGQTKEHYYFIMEYVDGMNLRQLIQAKTLEPRQALELVMQICTALQFAHDAKIVHRDIKPENILITKKGQVKVADFGLAKLIGGQPDTALTASQMVMGTLNYMAPEQREKPLEVDHRADIYSLGVVFYEMLTGEVPMGRFDAPSKKVQIDVRLDEVVLHALEREPARRYQQVSEVKSNVETITSSKPQEKKPPSAPEKFKLKAPLGFVSYVLPRFAFFAVALLGAGLCLRWAVGDTEVAVGTNGPSSLPMQILNGLLLVCLGFSYWGYAWWTLPVGFLVVLNKWLEKMAALGLTPRQIPQPIRRGLAQRLGWMTGGFIAAVLATLFLWIHLTANTSVSMREVQNRTDESTEWWFVPSSGAYEKLGLHATFSSSGETKNGAESLPACTVSIIVHRKDRETPVLNVTLPGLHTSYRFPATNSWDNTFILDKGSLVEWLHNGAGLDPAAPKFQEEAGQIYELLKAYEIQPPQTVKEFVNLAKADLQAFWFGGMQSGSFSYGGLTGANFAILIGLLVIEGFIYQCFMLGAIRRAYTAALLEIVDGRWTPPKPAPPFPTAIKVLVGLLALSLVCSFASSVARLNGKGDLDAAIVIVNLSSMLLVNFSLAVILIVALRFYSRQRIQQARAEGLWPHLDDLPTLGHVKALAQAGEMILAMKLYRQIHQVSWLDAKAAVEKLVG